MICLLICQPFSGHTLKRLADKHQVSFQRIEPNFAHQLLKPLMTFLRQILRHFFQIHTFVPLFIL